jgi:hypothetical protein
MKVFWRVVVVILQAVDASLLGFGGAVLLGVGEGWELVVFAAGYCLGVWGVGALAAAACRAFASDQGVRLIGTLLLSALGVALMLVTPPIGFAKAVYPLVGAMAGYYLAGLFARGPRPA